MKNSIFAILFLTFSVTAQTNQNKVEKDSTVMPIKEISTVPFMIINEVPIFPGCENETTKIGMRKCFNEKMTQHVLENFNAEIADCVEKKEVFNEVTNKNELQCVGLVPGKKLMYIMFKIGISGLVEDLEVRTSHTKIKEEGERVAKLLPKMIPGKHEGKPVRMGYTLPFIFTVE